jgi:polyphosphate glucokinase
VWNSGAALFESTIRQPVTVLNDADAAGVAEMKFGAGIGCSGIVMTLTFGTGIGSAVFVDGVLMPNTELGHIRLPNGHEGEHWAAAQVRESKSLSWAAWANRVNDYLSTLEGLFSPQLFVIGGGVSRKSDKFMHLLKTRARIVPAEQCNDAGIIGAAMAAAGH